LIFCAAILAYGQNGLAVSDFGTVAEPENHAVAVDRLMRYHDSGEYESQIRQVVNSAAVYLRERAMRGPAEKMAAVFDIDETSLSNWDVMADCGFCAYKFQAKRAGEAIAPTLELFNFAKSLGVYVFFVTGRQNKERADTMKNLTDVGYSGWTDLYMQTDGTTDPARIFKPRNRRDIESKGYRVVLSIGDQASDLAGCCAERVFKVPNPFYLVK